MPRIHVTRLVVGPESIDANRHVNNLEYLRWMQDSATAHSDAQGWTFERYSQVGGGWFVRSHYIKYQRPAFEGDVLLLYTWVRSMDRLTSPRCFRFLRESDGAILATAETVWVFVDFRSGRPTPIPHGVAAAFPLVADGDPELDRLAGRRGA